MNSEQFSFDEALLQRVYSEFLEMPGLRLTCRQAQRLWGLDQRTCTELLEYLVDAKFLCRRDHGMYTRLTDGGGRPSAISHGESPDRRRHRAQEGSRMTLGRLNPFQELEEVSIRLNRFFNQPFGRRLMEDAARVS